MRSGRLRGAIPQFFYIRTMNHLLETAQAISAIGFLVYGIGCLTTQAMRAEFVRYGLPELRVLTGVLQIAAAIGLFLGYVYPVCALIAAMGLSFMMVVALGVRWKIKDPFAGFLQALVCCLLNAYVVQGYLIRLGLFSWKS